MCGQRCMWITMCLCSAFFFFFNDTATTEIYTLSLHDALPICEADPEDEEGAAEIYRTFGECRFALQEALRQWPENAEARDRKSTRLNSSHLVISYAVFCLKKKTLISWMPTLMQQIPHTPTLCV